MPAAAATPAAETAVKELDGRHHTPRPNTPPSRLRHRPPGHSAPPPTQLRLATPPPPLPQAPSPPPPAATNLASAAGASPAAIAAAPGPEVGRLLGRDEAKRDNHRRPVAVSHRAGAPRHPAVGRGGRSPVGGRAAGKRGLARLAQQYAPAANAGHAKGIAGGGRLRGGERARKRGAKNSAAPSSPPAAQTPPSPLQSPSHAPSPRRQGLTARRSSRSHGRKRLAYEPPQHVCHRCNIVVVVFVDAAAVPVAHTQPHDGSCAAEAEAALRGGSSAESSDGI